MSLQAKEVSVIVLTYNSENTIRGALKSLAHQSARPKEVLVIDGGSADGTINAVETLRNTLEFPLLVLVADGSKSLCRNIGLQHSSGEIVAFLDSDCEAPPDWLENLASVLCTSDARVKAVGGPYVPSTDSHNFSFATYHLLGVFSGKLTSQFLRVEDSARTVAAIPGGNCAFWRRALLEVGGFDPVLRACEDTDISDKLVSSGYSLLFLPSLYVYHHWKGWTGLLPLARLGLAWGEGRITASRVRASLFPYGYLAFLLLLGLGTATEAYLAATSSALVILPVMTVATYLTFCLFLMAKHKAYSTRAVLAPLVFLASYGAGIVKGICCGDT